MFDVQVVRQRRANGALQALRRRFVMTVSDRCLKIALSSSSAAVISIATDRIKGVRVRGRLLRVVVDKGGFLTVRLQDTEEALRAAESMMQTWDIDPLVEDSEVSVAEAEDEVDYSMGGLVKIYMTDQKFRQFIHEIHDNVDAVLANRDLSYEAHV